MFRSALVALSLLVAAGGRAQGAPPPAAPPAAPPATTPATTPPPAPFPTTLEEGARQFDPNQPKPPAPTDAPTTPTPAPTASPAPPTGEVASVDGWTILETRSPRRARDGSETRDACGYDRDVIVERTHEGRLQTTPALLTVPCTRGADGLPAPGTPSLKLPPPYAPGSAQPLGGPGSAAIEVGVVGGLVQATVVELVLSHRAEIDACHPAGKGGLLVSRVVVGAGGRATEAVGQSGPLKGSAADQCLSTALRAWTWPKPADGHPAVVSVAVTWPDRIAGKVASTTLTAPTPPVCAEGVKPKAAAELKPGEVACIPATSPAGVVKVARPCSTGEKPKAPEELSVGELACKVEESERGVPFLKGELTHLGDVQLVNARTSFGIGLGLTVIDNVYFAVVRPDLNIHLGNLGFGLGAPLRFQVADLSNVDVLGGDPVGDVFGDAGRFRLEDWDQVEDSVRVLRYLTYGKKEDHVYVDVNRVHATTIGHGQLVRRYAPNLDIDEDNLFAQVDGYGDFGGVELMAGPFPLPRLVGGLVFIKPISILSAITPITDEGSYADVLADSWSIGVSYVSDLNSPTGLEGKLNEADQRFQLKVDSANQLVWRNKQNPIGDVVQGVGIDTEVKVLKLENVDVKVYGDYSHLFFPADSSAAEAFAAFDGGGTTVGGLLRVSFGETPVRAIEDEDEEVKAGRRPREKKAAHAFRVRFEGRTFAPTYLPSYFNTMYEIDRFQFGVSENRANLRTKVGYLADQKDAPWRVGYYAEASYAWVDALAVTAVFEDTYPLNNDDVLQAKNLALHLESQGLGWLQLFASYHHRNFDAVDFDKTFSFTTDNEILFAGARLQVLPIMFINVAAQRTFRIGFDDDDSPGTVDKDGFRYSSIGLQNVWAGGFDVEFGWQF